MEVHKILAAVSLWIVLGTTVIVFNAVILKSFPHPITLICWHMLVATVLVLCIRAVKPNLLYTGDDALGVAPLTLLRAIKLGTPIALFHALSMIFGNSAYLHLNVSFVQMIKAWTASVVYLVGCAMATQTWSLAIAKTILAITVGLSIASYGELDFNLRGFLYQVVSLSLEGLRINSIEILLKSSGYKLNPLSSLQIFAPLMLAILVPCVAVFDHDALSLKAIKQVGAVPFLANALCAFFLNMTVYLVIQISSGLIFALGGVVKDLLIIFGSAVFFSTPVTGLQCLGYFIALCGLQAYGVVSKDTARCESRGVLPVLWEIVMGFTKSRQSGNQELPQREESRDSAVEELKTIEGLSCQSEQMGHENSQDSVDELIKMIPGLSVEPEKLGAPESCHDAADELASIPESIEPNQLGAPDKSDNV